MRTERGEKGVKIRAYSYKEIKRKIWDLKDAEHLQTEPGVVSPQIETVLPTQQFFHRVGAKGPVLKEREL